MAPAFLLQRESRNAHQELVLSAEVFEIFQSFLEPGSSTSAAEAARSLDGLAAKRGGDNSDDFVWGTWNELFQIAQQIPYDDLAQDKLAKVVRELTVLQDSDSRVIWADLKQLSWAIRDWFNLSPEEKHANADEILKAWVNVNAFWARLGGTGIKSTADFAIWSLRQALEEEESNAKLRDNRVQAAAQYVEYQGHILSQQLRLGWKPREQEAQMYKGGSLFSGEPGLSDERWKFWISRFRDLAAEKTPTETGKSVALRAAKLLEIWHEEGRQ